MLFLTLGLRSRRFHFISKLPARHDAFNVLTAFFYRCISFRIDCSLIVAIDWIDMDETFHLAVLQWAFSGFCLSYWKLMLFLKMMQLPTVANIPFSSFLYSTVLLLCCIFFCTYVQCQARSLSLADIYTYYIERLHCCLGRRCYTNNLLYIV